LPEEVWKAIYFQYLPVAVEADAPPSRAQIGKAAITWAAVSLADKLDTIVGLLAAGEKPTGSRDPYGLRRAAQGVMKILVDFEPMTGTNRRPVLGPMLWTARDQIAKQLGLGEITGTEKHEWWAFFVERLRHLMETRGLDYGAIQAETAEVERIDTTSPADLLERARELSRARTTPVFASVAEAYKRAKNIVGQAWGSSDKYAPRYQEQRLIEPAETALRRALDRLNQDVHAALDARQPGKALSAIASIEPELARFFTEVRVMVDDLELQAARLALLAELRNTIGTYGDISAVAPGQL